MEIMLIYSRNDNSNQLTKDRFKYELAYELSDKNSLSMFNLEWTGLKRELTFLNWQFVAGGSLLLLSPFREK